MRHTVFVPKPNSHAFSSIAKGSAIVGKEYESLGYMVYYEGNLNGAENIKTFEDKAMIAAGRLEENYPTTAKMLCRKGDLIIVGYFDSKNNVFTPADSDTAKQALCQWMVE